MQKIMLTLLFCSVVTMANNDNEMNGILTTTLKKVKSFKQEKNQEIKVLNVQISLLKNKYNSSRNKQKKEIRELQNKLRISQRNILKCKGTFSKNKQKKEIRELKKKLEVSQKQISNYKQAQRKANQQLKEDKATIKDLHFMMKHKDKAVMDQYSLGTYYYNL